MKTKFFLSLFVGHFCHCGSGFSEPMNPDRIWIQIRNTRFCTWRSIWCCLGVPPFPPKTNSLTFNDLAIKKQIIYDRTSFSLLNELSLQNKSLIAVLQHLHEWQLISLVIFRYWHSWYCLLEYECTMKEVMKIIYNYINVEKAGGGGGGKISGNPVLSQENFLLL